MDDFRTWLPIFIACMLAWIVWIVAHFTVATECKKLGAFYVGETVYECKAKETP